MLRLGMKTVKLFTTYSDSGRRTDDETIIELLKLSNRYHFLVMAHVENDAMIKINPDYTYRDLPKSRPSDSELTEALKLAGFVKVYGGYLYMVHLSSGRTLERLISDFPDLINRRFFIESCPQYFLFNDRVLARADGYLYTCAPPLRSPKEQELLHKHKDHIATIATDHCAFHRTDKNREKLVGMPLGLGGIEFSFVTMRNVYHDELIERMSSRVAGLMGLEKKGRIAVGQDADLSFFNPKPQIVKEHHGRADYSVYEGQASAGAFVRVLLRGRWAMVDGQLADTRGQPLQGGTISCAKP
ncbi:MAG: amidohydrolase family protein, partial [Bacilli bacterium]|jgi:dihydropyrimidinase